MISRPGHRRRWRWQWGTIPFSKIPALDAVLLWVVLGAIVQMAVTGDNNPSTPLDWTVLGIWLGPIGLALIGLISGGVTFALLWVRDHPPIKREWEQLPDLREAEKQ